MAGRGRGRGRNVSFNVEDLGFGRGEALPGPILQPPPLFPQNDFKPVPLLQGDEQDYILALKQEFRGTIKRSPFFIKHSEKKKDIERYSDKYQYQNDSDNIWTPDYRRLPDELKPKEKKKRVAPTIKPNIPAKKAKVNKEEIQKTLEVLESKEKTEAEDSDEEKEEEKEEGEDNEEEVEYDDEVEEETDYLQSYFDNGEGYGDDDDDVDEGPVY